MTINIPCEKNDGRDRCIIGWQHPGLNYIKYVHCFKNGHPEWTGMILLNNYSHPIKLKRLVLGGDMLQLNYKIRSCNFFNGEDHKASIAANLDELRKKKIEYMYIFQPKKADPWSYLDRFTIPKDGSLYNPNLRFRTLTYARCYPYPQAQDEIEKTTNKNKKTS